MLENKKLAYKFLYFFSRFEFALKTTSFLLVNRNRISADWNKFAKSIDSKSKLDDKQSKELQESVKYFLDNPPKKQIINTFGALDWEEYKKQANPNFEELLMLVRRVRNNFFHGGKFSDGPVEGSERNKDLIKYSLIILKECLNLNQEVKEKFKENDNYVI